jgi:general secretion pathway protein A
VYTEYFGLSAKPFNVTPDPRFLFLSQRHSEALAHLKFGLHERGGFVLLTGEVGTGKTTLARHFLRQLDSRTATAVVLYPAVTASELLRSILDDLHIPHERDDTLKVLVDRLHQFLLQLRSENRDVVLVIDEAQDLTPELLEQIRLVSNLETDTEKLLQIVLVGQSELKDMLARSDLRQIAQRITARYHLTPLDRGECDLYISHRLNAVGGAGKVSFSTAALRRIHRLSHGIPRVINLLCDRCLLAGYVRGTRFVDAGTVAQAARETLATSWKPRRWPLVASGVAAVAIASLFFGAWAGRQRVPQAPSLATPPTLTPSPTTAPPPPTQLERGLLSGGPSTRPHAATLVASLWPSQALSATELLTDRVQIERLDLPVVLELSHPSRRDLAYLALLRLRGSTATLGQPGAAPIIVGWDEVERFWTRRAVVLWPDATDGLTDRRDRAAQRLGRLGYTEGDLEAAVAHFQNDLRLVSDGRIGPRTLMALAALTTQPRPRLSGEAP